MHRPAESLLLRVYVGESARHGDKPLYEALVLQARAHGLAGATVLRAALGYGATSRLHTAKILRLSTDLPLVIEIVDAGEKIHAFLPTLEAMLDGGLVTLQPVQVVQYRHGRSSQ